MGHPFENQPVVHNDQGHKKHQEEASLLLFHSANEDTIDVQHTRSPGHAAQQFNRDKHDQVDLLFLPLGTHDKHVLQTDEVSDTPICQTVQPAQPGARRYDADSNNEKPNSITEDRSARSEESVQPLKEISPAAPVPPPNGETLAPSEEPAGHFVAGMSLRQAEPAVRSQDFSDPSARANVSADYFQPPAVVHAEKHHKETDNQGTLAVGFFNGYEATSYDRQVRSAPGQYAEQTVTSKNTNMNIAWVVPAFSKDVSDVTWFKQTDVPIGPCVDDNPKPYYRKR